MKENAGKVMTVLGLIDPEALGHTLVHEHTLTNLLCYASPAEDPEEAKLFKEKITLENLRFVHDNPYAIEENCICQDSDLIVKELELFKKAGGGSICDLTTQKEENGAYFEGSDFKMITDTNHWLGVRDIAERSGVNIILSVGHYMERTHPKQIKEMTAERLAGSFIDVVRNGYGDTEIRPGILGEIGVGPVLHDEEIKVLRTVALTQAETGLGVNVHMEPYTWEYDFRVLDILEESGADLTRVAILDREASLTNRKWSFHDALDHLVAICDRGAFVAFDTCGNNDSFYTEYATWDNPSDAQRAIAVNSLCNRGHAKRVLLSQDTAHRYLFTSYGGSSFIHLLTKFRNMCLQNGVTEYDYETILVRNPKYLLTIK